SRRPPCPPQLRRAAGSTRAAYTTPYRSSLSESGPSDYTASPYSCVKNGAPAVSGNGITLSNGDTATCTITNDDKAPSLTLVKHVTNDNGGARTATEWTLNAKRTPLSSTNLSTAYDASS